MSKECCGPDEPAVVDTCCGGGPSAHLAHGDHQEATVWWQDREVLVPLGAGVLLAIGYALGWSGLDVASTVLLAGSLAVGGSTFVPSAPHTKFVS